MIYRTVKFLRYFYNEPYIVINGVWNKLMRILFQSRRQTGLIIYMEPSEIEYVKDILINKNIKNILEWGSGGSTILFGKFLDDNGKKDVNWYSIEHDIAWYNKIKKNTRENTRIQYLPTNQNNYTDIKNKNYVEFPRTLGIKFDLVLIDGRFRRRCLIEAVRHLQPSGIVILHDAPLRKYYHCAFKHYQYGKFTVGTIWEGTNECAE